MPLPLAEHRYCHRCAAPYEHLIWPRQCKACGSMQYLNPTPVAVILVPVWDCHFRSEATSGTRRGIIVGKRGHEPGLGLWGLPGGFVEHSETNEDGGHREMLEETGLRLNPEYISLTHSRNNSTGSQLLTFSEYTDTLSLSEVMPRFKPCAECPEIDVAFEPIELAFPTHTEALRLWFDKQV